MKEELISFETAKLAKEKGFNIKIEQRFLGIEGYTRKVYKDLEVLALEYCQPTQSTLQKWLRDVHNLYPFAWCNASGWGWELEKTNGTHISIMDIDGDVEGTEPESGMFKSYEEALEKGLQEALKLIVI